MVSAARNGFARSRAIRRACAAWELGSAGEIDESPERRRQMTPARIVEVVAGVLGAPVFQDTHQASLGDVLFNLFLEREGDAGAIKRGADR